MHQSVLALNLSYVLHEPSSSRAVVRAANTARRFHRRRSSLLQSYASLADQEFANFTIVAPSIAGRLEQTAEIDPAFTAAVGLPELLPRTLRVIRGTAPTPELVQVDNPDIAPESSEALFFGAPARLSGFDRVQQRLPAAVLALVVRPGAEGLMLVGDIVTHSEDSSANMAVSLTKSLERLIRDYADQWTPLRSLWPKPAEATLPEVLKRNARAGGR